MKMYYKSKLRSFIFLLLGLSIIGYAAVGMAGEKVEKPSVSTQLFKNLKRAFSKNPNAPQPWEEGYEGEVSEKKESKKSKKNKKNKKKVKNIQKKSVQKDFVMAAFLKNYKAMDIQNTYYIDNKNGNDRNNGKSESKAWKTIDRLNKAGVPSQSAVYFKKGQIFRGFIDIKNNDMKYGSYGNGKKPIILGSLEVNNPKDWKNEGGGIWSFSSPVLKPDVGNIIFNNGEKVGVKKLKKKNLKQNEDFFIKKRGKILYVYSDKNPAQKWDDIELALLGSFFKVKDVERIWIKDLDLRYTAGHAISIEDAKDVVVQNMDISYIGGGNLFAVVPIPGNKRFGNGIEIYGTNYNVLIEGNSLDEIYDAALTNQSYNKKGNQRNITYRNNKVNRSEYCFEIWYYAKNSSMRDVLFENNECKGTGKGWGHFQRPDGVNARNIMVFSNLADTSNVVIRNNKFFESTESHKRFADPADEKEFRFENNEFIRGKMYD